MQTLFRDIHYSLRQLRKSPVFFSIIVLTLGLGIGVNTAIFSMVDWLVLRSLPVKDPDECTFWRFPTGRNAEVQFSYPEFAEIRKQTTDVFSAMAPFIFGGLEGAQNSQSGLTADVTRRGADRLCGRRFLFVAWDYPAVGRFILSSEGRPPALTRSRPELQLLANSL